MVYNMCVVCVVMFRTYLEVILLHVEMNLPNSVSTLVMTPYRSTSQCSLHSGI